MIMLRLLLNTSLYNGHRINVEALSTLILSENHAAQVQFLRS
jgi:hypothetical protein